MRSIKSLKVVQLKRLLEERNSSTTGTKATLINRLSEIVGSEEIEFNEDDDEASCGGDEVVEQCEIEQEQSIQQQVNELRGMLQSVLSCMQNNPQNNVAQNQYSVQRENLNLNSISPYSNTSTRNSYSVREIAETIPDFDPTNDNSLSAEQFIERVNSVIRAYEWNEKCLLLAVFSRMKGVARLWLDATEKLYSNWNDFARELKIEFGDSPDEAQIHFEMQSAVRKQDEKVSDYCFRVCALGRRYKLSETAMVKYARNGLRNRELQIAIAAHRINTMKELRETLKEYEKNSSINMLRNTTKFEIREQENKNVNKSENSNKKIETAIKKTVKCYNCDEMGHIAINCQKPQRKQKCGKCNKVHLKGDSECKSVAKIRNTFYEFDEHFKVNILINGQLKKAFIDTGAQCSMIRKSVCDKLGLKCEQCAIKITGICGGLQHSKEVVRKNVLVENVEIPVNLHVVNDELLPSDILLGQDNFVNNKLRLTIKNGGIKIEREREIEVKEIKRIINKDEIKCEVDDNFCKTELMKIINENASVFANNLSEIGKTDLVKMKIELNSNEIVTQSPYRVPEPKKQVVEQMVSDLLKNDLIQRSESEFASPVVLVKKKNGNDRLCIDYRRLNKLMVKEIFPVPNIEECLQEAARYKYFSTLDLNSGYYQIEIEPESRKYTAFITTDGLYEFKRMPFGLKNAPVVFQRLMSKIQEKAGKENMMHYMDDMLICSNTYDEMFMKISKILNILKEAKLTLNISKCEFLKTTINFLGHRISPNGLTPGIAKTTAIQNYERPTNVTEIRRFLGLSGYFRKFIPAYAIISEPLRKLLRKNEQFYWTNEQEKAFNELKQKLTSEPVLVAYNVNARHEIHTDASSAGLAGVLLQDESGGLKPVAYYSRSTSDTENKFHSYELETLAVVETLERFKYYVDGKKITVVTDCSAVRTAMEKRELIPRIARWWLRVQDFDIDIVHRQGRRMEHVDALSRCPNEIAKETDVATLRVDKIAIAHDDWLYSMQLQDEKISKIIERLKMKDKQTMSEFCNDEGRLFKIENGKKLWVVPKTLRHKMVEECHDKNGHLGLEKTVNKMKTYMWFPRMRNFVKAYLKAGVECAYNKARGGRMEGEYHFSKIEPIPFKTLHMDHLGPFIRSTKGNEHIVILVDAFTKYTIIKAVKSTATKHVLTTLREVTSYFGVPEIIITDRGTSFTSKDFKNYCIRNDIKHVLNAVRTPRANGHAERANRTLLSMLLPMTTTDKKWDENLYNIQWSMNTMKNKTTKRSPHEVLFSFSPRDILQNKVLLALHENYLMNDEDMKNLRLQVAGNVNQQRQKAKERYDKYHNKPTEFHVNDLVLVENEPPSTGTSRKLEPKYKGPFIIAKVLGKDRYLIKDLPNSKRTSRHYTSVYASDKLKAWCKLPENFETDDEESDNDNKE